MQADSVSGAPDGVNPRRVGRTTGQESPNDGMRNAFHIFVSVLMWCVFGYYWYLVGRDQINSASIQAVGTLGLITILGLLVTIWWIVHNKRVAGRYRRRKEFQSTKETYDNDFLGRPIVGSPPAELRQARTIVVAVDDDGNKVCTATTGRGD